MSDFTTALPLFPLGTILFPGASLDLHIFEERYRQMIGRCLSEERPFGVVLIHTGTEVEEGRIGSRPAEPYTVGTFAHIASHIRLEDGRYLINVAGGRRFRISAMRQRVPYLTADVELLDEPEPEPVALAARNLRVTYERYWRGVSHLAEDLSDPTQLPNDVTALSYFLADRFQIPLERKQHWLETDLLTRLREQNAMLRAELSLLPRANDDTQRGGNLN